MLRKTNFEVNREIKISDKMGLYYYRKCKKVDNIFVTFIQNLKDIPLSVLMQQLR